MSQSQPPGEPPRYPPSPNPTPPDQWNRQPWERPPAEKPKSTATVVIVVLAVVGLFLLLVIGGTVLLLVTFWDQIDAQANRKSDAIVFERREPNESSRKAVREAFNKREVNLSESQRQAVHDSLMDALALDDTPESVNRLNRLIDYLSMRDEIEKSPHADLSQGGISQSWLRTTDHTPSNYEFAQIAHVERLSDQKILVYAHVRNEGHYFTDARYWMSEFGPNRWRLYDWEEIDEGLRFSDHIAALIYHIDEIRYRDYDQFFSRRQKMFENRFERPREESLSEVEITEQIYLGPQLEHTRLYWIGLDYYNFDEFEKCLEICSRIGSPERCPGRFFLESICYLNLNQLDRAERSARNYVELIGETPPALEVLAEIANYREDYSREAQIKRRIALLVPDSAKVASEVATNLSPKQVGDYLGEILDRQSQREILIRSFVEAFRNGDAAVFPMTALKLQLEPTDAHWNHLVSAEVFRINGDSVSAAESYQAAMAAASDDDFRDWVREMALEVYLDVGQVNDAYQMYSDKEKAFRAIVDELEYQYYETPFSALDALVETHVNDFPDDRFAQFHLAQRLRREGDQAGAIEIFTSIAQDASTDDDLRDRSENLRSMCLLNLGRLDEALAIGEEVSDRFEYLADSLVEWGEAGLLSDLIEKHAGKNGEDPWLDYYRAKQFELQKQYDRAARLCGRRVQETRDAEEDNEDSSPPETLEYEWVHQAVFAHANGQDPQTELSREQFEMVHEGYRPVSRLAECKSLLELVVPEDREGLAYRLLKAKVAWQESEYQSIARGFDPSLLGGTDDDDASLQRQWMQIAFKSHLRLEEWDRAEQIATIMETEFDDRSLRFALAMIKGQSDKMLEMIEQETDNKFIFREVLNDDHYGIGRGEFPDVRRLIPDWLYSYQGTEDIYLLLEKPIESGTGQWYAGLKARFPANAEFSPMEVSGRYPAVDVVSVSWGENYLYLSYANGQLQTGNGYYTAEQREWLRDHQALLGIHLPAGEYEDLYRICDQPLHEQVSRLVNDGDLSGIAVFWAFHQRLMDMAAAKEWLTIPLPALHSASPGRHVYVVVPPAPSVGVVRHEDVAMELVDQLIDVTENIVGKYQVRLDLQASFAVEPVWFDVYNVERISTSEYYVDAQLASPSRVLFDAADRQAFRFELSEVMAIRPVPASP